MTRGGLRLLVVSVAALLAAAASALVLHQEGVQFPDGSVQVTAAMSTAEIARGGVNHSCRLLLEDGSDDWAPCNFVVPEGHILVVEYVSLAGTAPSGVVLGWGCFDFLSGEPTALALPHAPLSRVTGPSGERYEAGQLYRAYVRGERTFEMVIVRDSTVGQVDVTVAFSGYLVPE